MKMRIAMICAISLTAALTAQSGFAGQDDHIAACLPSTTEAMVTTLKLVFPAANLGPVEQSACYNPEFPGVDGWGVIILKQNAGLEGVPFSAVDDESDFPASRFDALLPGYDIAAHRADYLLGYGFSRDSNAEVFILRRADGTGPVLALIADIL